MDKKERLHLLKEYLLVSDKDDQAMADDVCFYCSIYEPNKGEGLPPCKFKDICGTDRDILKFELRSLIDEL
jgi:hypothetical protein